MCPEDTEQHSSDLKLVEPGVAESPRSHLATDVPIPNNSYSLHSLLCNTDLQDIFPAFQSFFQTQFLFLFVVLLFGGKVIITVRCYCFSSNESFVKYG